MQKTSRSAAPSGPGGVLSRLDIAAVRISSDQINDGSKGRFTVMTSQVITRAIGFYVHSAIIPNSWYNVTNENNVSYWGLSTVAGVPPAANAIFPVIVPTGFYNSATSSGGGSDAADFGTVLAQQISIAIDPNTAGINGGPFSRGKDGSLVFNWGPILGQISVNYQAASNRWSVFVSNTGSYLYYYTSGGLGPTTSNNILGFTQNHNTGNNASTGLDAYNIISSDQQINFEEPAVIGIMSPQLRRQVSIDGSGGQVANDCFHHQPVTAPKMGPIIYYNPAPTEMSVIKFAGETTLQQIDIQLMNPSAKTHRVIHPSQNWEVVLHFLFIP